ncbi:DUF2934 domain-containing protein [Inquilinus ginsengisoli]|uniref:DUF2934 domain-containing protein n=1 Tax=Inquilinus ginsengisoli TaxID=363840 RepID=UPI003D2137EE
MYRVGSPYTLEEGMVEDRLERIRQRAYDIWHREGRPDGREQEHWDQAVAEIEAEDRPAAESTPEGVDPHAIVPPGKRSKKAL